MHSLKERWVNWTQNPGRVDLVIQLILAVSLIGVMVVGGLYLLIAAKYQTFFNPF